LTAKEALPVVRKESARLLGERVPLEQKGKIVDEPHFADLGVSVPSEKLVAGAVAFGRGRGSGVAVDWARGVTGATLPLRFEVQSERLEGYVQRTFAESVRPARSAAWNVESDGAFTLVPAVTGSEVDIQQLARDIIRHARRGDHRPVSVRFVQVEPAMSDHEAQALRPEVERIVAAPFVLVLDERRWEVPLRTVRSWVTLEHVGSRPAVTFSQKDVEKYLTEVLAPDVNQRAHNARFAFVGGRVSAFSAPQDGIALEVAEGVRAVREAVAQERSEAALATTRTKPEITTTADIERLGIRTLLGRGESDFSGSPRNRIHNIRVGAARYHGLLIPPGAEFSFNEFLGPVEASTGYLPELVILENVTTPQYGGGLCQVSTTAFRAAVLSGLTITARKNHAYPVSYYGTPGFDATIYPPSPDLKFLNDTPGHILIQTRVEGMKLVFEFWGTSDGREVRIVGPSPYGRRPDRSVKATLTQQIYRDGALARVETFLSSYKSPRLFPRVLAANAESETWEKRVRRITEKDRKAHEEFLKRQAVESTRTRPTPSPTPPAVSGEAQ
jgi:vancomycin resistance protein YoaR